VDFGFGDVRSSCLRFVSGSHGIFVRSGAGNGQQRRAYQEALADARAAAKAPLAPPPPPTKRIPRQAQQQRPPPPLQQTQLEL
jgi:hypothetical protein